MRTALRCIVWNLPALPSLAFMLLILTKDQ